MDRRAFLRGGIAGASAWLAPKTVFASQSCGQAATTPYGPVQRCTAGIKSVALQPVQSYQQQNEWCWAACISMVFAYYGHRVSQQRIVKEVWGRVVNMRKRPILPLWHDVGMSATMWSWRMQREWFRNVGLAGGVRWRRSAG
jgi:hypothetical protein